MIPMIHDSSRGNRNALKVGTRIEAIVHAEGMLLSRDPPINRRSIHAPHKHSGRGMEGSTGTFMPLYVRLSPKGNQEAEQERSKRPMTVQSQSRKAMITIARRETLGRGGNNEPAEAVSHPPGTLPDIIWEENEKKCCDCNNPTHLHWHTETIEWWLCQGCAKRRGDPYALTIRAFTSFFEAKAENWLRKRILV